MKLISNPHYCGCGKCEACEGSAGDEFIPVEELVSMVVGKANELGYFDSNTLVDNADTLVYEFTRLREAIFSNQSKVVSQAFGKVMLSLVILAEHKGLDIHCCLADAYDQIKARKGKMVNGKFIKESR